MIIKFIGVLIFVCAIKIVTVQSTVSGKYDRYTCIFLKDSRKLYCFLRIHPKKIYRHFLSKRYGYNDVAPLICRIEKGIRFNTTNIVIPKRIIIINLNSTSNYDLKHKQLEDANQNCKNESENNIIKKPGSVETIKKVMKLLPEDCGRDISNRIVGGTRTELGEFPWTILLEFSTEEGIEKLVCGGVLINSRYVITAAHCIQRRGITAKWTLKAVRLGEYNITSPIDCVYDVCADKHISVPIEEEIVHENFTVYSKNEYNDIALLRLSQNVKFTEYIKPICLPEGSKVKKWFTITGWGSTKTRIVSDVKLKVTLPLVDAEKCQQVYSSSSFKKRIIIDSQICVGGEKGKDSCTNDSGNPLMQQNKRSDNTVRWEVAGIVSYGPVNCGTENWPGVYTNISYYKSWILSKLRP